VGPFAEIKAVADLAATRVAAGNERGGAMAFVDYWSGPGAWEALRPAVQDALIRWMPKAPLDFAALFEEPTRWEALARLNLPTLIIGGERAPASSPIRCLRCCRIVDSPLSRAPAIWDR
jgi:pimeloyl-ACP methyl ester carboxylesterase